MPCTHQHWNALLYRYHLSSNERYIFAGVVFQASAEIELIADILLGRIRSHRYNLIRNPWCLFSSIFLNMGVGFAMKSSLLSSSVDHQLQMYGVARPTVSLVLFVWREALEYSNERLGLDKLVDHCRDALFLKRTRAVYLSGSHGLGRLQSFGARHRRPREWFQWPWSV
jgi:hypothetical protein